MANVVIPITAKMHNRFDFEVIDGRTGKVRQRAFAENIILDSYWTKLFAPALANSHIHVGTGTGVLDPTRTSLFTFLVAKSSTEAELVDNRSEGWTAYKRLAQWSEAENQNTAWTEVGIAYGTNSGYLTTHALIKDMNGNQVTINKGTDDIITVYATIYVYTGAAGFDSGNIWPVMTSKDPTSIGSNGLISWMFGRNSDGPAARTHAFKGDLFVGSVPENSFLAAYNLVNTGVFSAANKKVIITMARLAAGSGNVETGIKGLILGDPNNSYYRHVDLNIKIPCTAYPYSTIIAESIGTGDGNNLDFETAFPFVKNDASFVLYKNGTPVSTDDYTVDFGIPNQKDVGLYFNLIEADHRWAIPYGSTGATTVYGRAGYSIVENTFYATYGINTIYHGYTKISASDDLVNWSTVSDRLSDSKGTATVAAEHVNKRYWKIETSTTAASTHIKNFYCNALDNKKNIHFGAGKAPAIGDTITADYRCEVIAKDANHVFDLTVEITLQEKTT